MSRVIRWETPFTDAFYPSIIVAAIPLSSQTGMETNNLKAVVSPHSIEYPKNLIDFGEVLAFTCMEESCSPQIDFSSATFDETITGDKFICALQWLGSPWLNSYAGCHDPEGEGKFSHYLLLGGDNNVQVITQNAPQVEQIEGERVLQMQWKV